jgi:hypothetical protein
MVSDFSFWMAVTASATVCVVTHYHGGGRVWTGVRDDDCELQASVSLPALCCT